MGVTLTSAGNYLKGVYRDMVADELSRLKTPTKNTIPSQSVRCRVCGRSGVTLRKTSDGGYICNDCLKEDK